MDTSTRRTTSTPTGPFTGATGSGVLLPVQDEPSEDKTLLPPLPVEGKAGRPANKQRVAPHGEMEVQGREGQPCEEKCLFLTQHSTDPRRHDADRGWPATGVGHPAAGGARFVAGDACPLARGARRLAGGFGSGVQSGVIHVVD